MIGSSRLSWIDIAANPDPLREVLGYLPQDFGVYPNLNAVEFLEYMAAINSLTATTGAFTVVAKAEKIFRCDALLRTCSGVP